MVGLINYSSIYLLISLIYLFSLKVKVFWKERKEKKRKKNSGNSAKCNTNFWHVAACLGDGMGLGRGHYGLSWTIPQWLTGGPLIKVCDEQGCQLTTTYAPSQAGWWVKMYEVIMEKAVIWNLGQGKRENPEKNLSQTTPSHPQTPHGVTETWTWDPSHGRREV